MFVQSWILHIAKNDYLGFHWVEAFLTKMCLISKIWPTDLIFFQEIVFIYFPIITKWLVSRKLHIIGRVGCYLSALILMHITQVTVEHGNLKCTRHPLIPNSINLKANQPRIKKRNSEQNIINDHWCWLLARITKECNIVSIKLEHVQLF